MSMMVAIRPASLYTHVIFTVLPKLEKSRVSQLDQSRIEFGRLRGEVRQWISISSTSHKAPWQKTSHFTAALTGGATDAPSTAWRGVVNVTPVPFHAGGGV